MIPTSNGTANEKRVSGGDRGRSPIGSATTCCSDWFVAMEMDKAVRNRSVYGKNGERLLNEEIAERSHGAGWALLDI